MTKFSMMLDCLPDVIAADLLVEQHVLYYGTCKMSNVSKALVSFHALPQGPMLRVLTAIYVVIADFCLI